MKKILIFLTALAVLTLFTSLPIVQAEEETCEGIKCSDYEFSKACATQLQNCYASCSTADEEKYEDYIEVSISEPLSEEKVESGWITYSEIKWKYPCISLTSDGTPYLNYDYGNSCPTEELSSASCQKVQLLRAKTGAGLLKLYIAQIYKWGASIVGIIAVLIIIISGIQMAASAGGEGVTAAKNRIMQALAALVLLFLSALLLYTINPTFFTT